MSGKNWKNSINLSSAELAKRVVKVKSMGEGLGGELEVGLGAGRGGVSKAED